MLSCPNCSFYFDTTTTSPYHSFEFEPDPIRLCRCGWRGNATLTPILEGANCRFNFDTTTASLYHSFEFEPDPIGLCRCGWRGNATLTPILESLDGGEGEVAYGVAAGGLPPSKARQTLTHPSLPSAMM